MNMPLSVQDAERGFLYLVSIRERALMKFQSTLFPCRYDKNKWVIYSVLTGEITSILLPIVINILNIIIVFQCIN